MKNFRDCIFLLLFMSICIFSNSQDRLNELQSKLSKSKDDTSKVDILNVLSDLFLDKGNNEKSLIFANQALELSQKLTYKLGISHANMQIGIIYVELGSYEKALKYYLQSLKICEEIRDKKGEAYLYNNIANIHREQGDPKKALENYLLSLKKCEAINDQEGISKASFGAGIVYRSNGDYDKALEYYFKSMKIDESRGNYTGVAHTYTSIGIVYSIKGSFDTAISYYSKSLKVALESGDKKEIALCKINIGCTYIDLKDFEKAEENLNEALLLFTEIGHKNGVKEVYSSLSTLFENKKEFKKSLQYHKLYSDIKDELISESSSNQMVEMIAKYDTEKKIIENKTLQQKNKIQALTIANGRYFMIGIIGFFILVVILGFLIFRQNRLRAQQLAMQFEQKLLRTQMNPHFIFNSLASIESFIYEHEPKIAGVYLSKFSRLMRLILENSASEFISLEEEVEILNYYLSLQKMRLNDQLEYQIYIDPEIHPERMQIPPMLLQPFIENAIEHGFRGNKNIGKVDITFELVEHNLCVTIIDNGIGIDKAKDESSTFKTHKSLALKITQERLELLNKTKRKKLTFSISDISSAENELTGTEVKFSIPT